MRMSGDAIAAVIKMRASILRIANELEGLEDIKPRHRVSHAIHLADRLKNIISGHAVVEACKRNRSTVNLCEGCPPYGYPTDKTRCEDCPRQTLTQGASHEP